MTSLITVVVLCTAFLVAINAAPVLPSGYELETLRDRDAQAGGELEQASVNVVRSLLSAASKKADQNDDLQQSSFNGFNSVLPSFGKRLSNEGGDIQSDDEMMQALFGTTSMKSDEVHVQLDNELLLNLINAVRAILSSLRKESDTNGEPPQILEGFDSILSVVKKRLDKGQESVGDNEIRRIILDAVDNMFSALGRNADPNDEVTQTFFNGFRTLLSLIRYYEIENSNGEGVIQSSDDEMRQAVVNILGNNGEIQTANDDEFERTLLNIMKAIFSAGRRNSNNELVQAVFDVADIMFSFAAKVNGENQPTYEEFLNKFISHFNNIIPALVKEVEKGKIKSPDGAGEAKTPQWGGILGSLATGVLNKYLSG